jgi:hypothetical protein
VTRDINDRYAEIRTGDRATWNHVARWHPGHVAQIFAGDDQALLECLEDDDPVAHNAAVEVEPAVQFQVFRVEGSDRAATGPVHKGHQRLGIGMRH